jgi:carboxyvinyl-carboxyphosphonate phosphorylmutase
MAGLLPHPEQRRATLVHRLDEHALVVAPGAYDALSARLVEEAGFPAVYMTGFGTAAGRLGRPDVGLLTMTEMAENARRIADAVALPVIADADTGYGNAINVVRTVREYERAGVAAIQLEDQVWPKRCGHMEGKRVIAAAEMEEKVRAAVAARDVDDFLVIARTDARAPLGLEDAVARAHGYRAAGADLLFVEALESNAEVELVARELAGVPLVFNWAEGGKTPPLAPERLRELGFRLVIFPLSALLAALRGIREVLAAIRETGTPAPLLADLPSFADVVGLLGLDEVRTLERRFARAG